MAISSTVFYFAAVLALSMALQSEALSETAIALDHLGEAVSARKAARAARGAPAFVPHRSSKTRRQQVPGAASLAQMSSPKSFPAYTRSTGYVHPLDDAGQRLEKQSVAQLSPANVMDHLTELLQFPTRSYSNAAASQKVEEYLKHTFKQMGLTTCFHNLKDAEDDANSPTLTNVIAYIPGSSADTVTVGAHYDSRPFEGKAPGAEDNGSGVASMLAVAKAFTDAKITPEKSVYFVAFAGEEPGLVGSKAFAEDMKSGSEAIPAECRPSASFLQVQRKSRAARKHQAIVLDEVGWASPSLSTPTVNLESFDWTKEVMDHLRESSQTHNGDAMAVVHSNNPFGSDHMSFLDNEMQAVLTINGDDESYPHYHQSSDTIENVSPELVSMISKMNMGALIRLAGIRSA